METFAMVLHDTGATGHMREAYDPSGVNDMPSKPDMS